MNELISFYTSSGIRSEFLTVANYKSTYEYSLKRHDNYIRYCTLIKAYYFNFQAAGKNIQDRIKLQPNDQLNSIKQFKQFLMEFAKNLEQIAFFKIGFYQQLQETQIDPIRRPTDELIIRIGKYSEIQKQFQQNHQALINNVNTLKTSYSQLKKETKNAVTYFDQKYVRPKVQQLQSLIKSKQQSQAQSHGLLQTVYNNSMQFANDITNYRARLMSGKYKTFKKISEMSRGARQCLTQTLISLFQMTTNRHLQFQQLLRESIRESLIVNRYKKKSNIRADDRNQDKLTEIIINAMQQYNDLIDKVQSIVKYLIDSFAMFSNGLKDKGDSIKIIAEVLNNLYENDQNPTPEMLDTIDSFNYFCQKIGDIPNMLHLQLSAILKLRQNINKHSQITLSLLKCHKGILDPNNNKGFQQLNSLFDQLSYDYINQFMNKIYKEIEDTLSKIKNYFNTKYHKKKKNNLEDSMDVSHIQQQKLAPQKRPSKQEIWLWKQFRSSQKYKKIKIEQDLIKEINKFIQPFLDIKIESQKEVQKFNCSLTQRKGIKGVLKILEKNITFSSSNNQVEINIPLQFVCQVIARIKTFEKQLSVVTSMGQIIFDQFPQISKAEVLMQQQMNSSSNSKQTAKKLTVQLTPEEIKFLQDRREKINGQLQSIQGYELQASVVMQNTTVDVVYDTIYSDKPFKFKGKQYACFFEYALKKTNCFNFTGTKYEPVGPKFYSLEDGKTFINCPLTSSRTSEYEVPLPPIPFMPKTCINSEAVKIYWISNEQFDYSIRSQSKGAPYADCFFINILHRIAKKQKGVQLKIFFKITFVKDCAMKGMINSKSNQQSKSKNTVFVTQAEKIVKMAASGGQGDKTGKKMEEMEEKQTEKSTQHPKMKKLESQNKILIAVLVAVILINLLLRLF